MYVRLYVYYEYLQLTNVSISIEGYTCDYETKHEHGDARIPIMLDDLNGAFAVLKESGVLGIF